MNIRWWDEHGGSELQIDYRCVAYVFLRAEQHELWDMPPDEPFYTWHIEEGQHRHFATWIDRKAKDDVSFEAAKTLDDAKAAVIKYWTEYLAEMSALVTGDIKSKGINVYVSDDADDWSVIDET